MHRAKELYPVNYWNGMRNDQWGLLEIGCGCSRNLWKREEDRTQLLFLAYAKQEKKKAMNKYSFQASLFQLKLPTYIVVEAEKLFVAWVRY